MCCYFLPEMFELEIVILNAKIMFWTHFPDFLGRENYCRQFVVVGYFKHICLEIAEKKSVEHSYCALTLLSMHFISNAVCMAYLANIQHTSNLLISPK